MDTVLTGAEKIRLMSRYIGQEIWVRSIYGHELGHEPEHQVGRLTGVMGDAVQVLLGNVKRWFVLDEKLNYYDLKLLLKPLRQLTPEIMATANALPVAVFITQYYVQLGFDMPVYVAPDHPLNCQYMEELALADYRPADEILMLNRLAVAG